METQENFYGFMSGYTDFLERMAEAEDEKYRAVISYNLAEMDQAISDQQAMLMKLERMEKQREQAQIEAGFSELGFRQIIDRLEGAEQERFLTLFRRAEKAIQDIRYLNEKSLSAAKANLQTLGSLPAADTGAQGGYSAEGKKAAGGNVSLFEAKI